MAFGSDRSANFVIAAKDAATKPLGNVGKAMGRLKGASITAFKAIGGAALAAAGAIAAFTIAAIKGAMDDEKQTIRLNAALKARGFAMDQLGPKIDEQIKAMARLGFTDDQVRDGLEVGSRFFKNQNKLLKANALAANISAATGKDLSTVMLAIGKGSQGSLKGLAGLGIEVKKGAKLTDILTAGNKKYKDVAEEVANSTAGKFEAAQIRLNESFESFGAKFLPKVNDALEFLTTNILPGVETGMDNLGGAMVGVIDNLSAPGGLFESVGKVAGEIFDNFKPELEEAAGALGGLFDSVGKLIGALWGDGDGALAGAFKLLGGAIEVAFAIAKPFFDALKWLVDNITTVLDAMNKIGAAQTVEKGAKAAAGAGYGGGSFVNPMNATGGGNPGSTSVVTNIVLDKKVIGQSAASYMGMLDPNPRRTYP